MLVFLVPIFIRNVLSLAPVQRAPESAHIVELASGRQPTRHRFGYNQRNKHHNVNGHINEAAHALLTRIALSNSGSQASLRMCADSPETLLVTYTSYGCKSRLRTIL